MSRAKWAYAYVLVFLQYALVKSYGISNSPHWKFKTLRLTVSVFVCTLELTALLLKGFHLHLHSDTVLFMQGLYRCLHARVSLKRKRRCTRLSQMQKYNLSVSCIYLYMYIHISIFLSTCVHIYVKLSPAMILCTLSHSSHTHHNQLTLQSVHKQLFFRRHARIFGCTEIMILVSTRSH